MTARKLPFRPHARALALEPRILFDGAAAAAVEHQSGAQNQPAEQAAGADHARDASPDSQAATATRPSSTANSPAAQATTLLIVDSRIADYNSLIAGLPNNVTVRLVGPGESGITAISNALAQQGQVQSVQILSHGSAGQFTLGSDTIGNESLAGVAGTRIQGWREHLTANADILLYGCNTGADAAGATLVARLAELTGADVAASTDATGTARLGADWVLERSTGAIETTLALSSAALQGYDRLLAAPSVSTSATGITVIEPSTLNAIGADKTTLSGWVIGDDGIDSTDVTVEVTVGDIAKGTLSNPGGAMGGTVSAIAGGFRYVGTPGDAQAWVNQLVYSAADVELGITAATDTLTVTVTDGETPALSASRSIGITVTPSNDPVQVPDGTLTVSEGSPSTTVTAAALAALDPEVAIGTQNATQIVYRLTDMPTNGYLVLAGNRIGIGSTFTQAQVLANQLVYVHTASGSSQNDPDSFSVSVNDGATPQNRSDTATVAIGITPVNQAPTAGGSGDIFEGQPRNATSGGVPQSVVGNFIVANAGGDPGDSITSVKVTSLPGHGTLYFNGTATIDGVTQTIDRALTAADLAGSGFVIAYADRGGLTYANDGVDGNSSDGFGISVTDGGGGTGAPLTTIGSVTLNILPVNDDPTFAASTLEATVTANGPNNTGGDGDDYRVTLTTTMLNVADVDSPNTAISFVLMQPPADGILLLNNAQLKPGATFTMDDVINGRVQYLQTADKSGDANPTDSFQFQVQDNTQSLRWDAAGEDFERVGGIYSSPEPGGILNTYTFTINLDSSAPTVSPPATTPVEPTPAPIEPPSGPKVPTKYAGHNPTTGVDSGVLSEGGAVTIYGDDGNAGTPLMLYYEAGDVPATQLVYTITGFGGVASGWNGQVQKDAGGGTWVTLNVYDTFTQDDLNNGRVRFVHDGGEDFESTFSYQVSAGGLSLGSPAVTTGAFTFYIAPINDAPTTTGSNGAFGAEGSTIGITTNELSFGDADDATSEGYLENTLTIPLSGIPGSTNYAINNDALGGPGLKFKITDLPDHGKLQWNNGGTWTDITVADLNSTLFNSSLLSGAAGTTGLRYVHDGLEDRGDSFKVKSVDRWSVESSEATVSLTLYNVNDGPQIASDPTQGDPPPLGSAPNNIGGASVNEPLYTIYEGGYTQITAAMLQAYDPDSTSQQVQYRITTGATQGRIAYFDSGTGQFTTIGVGSSFTQQQVTDGKIYYIHEGAEPNGNNYPATLTDDRFIFTIADGDKEQTGNEFWIYVKPTNDAPVVTAPSGPIMVDTAGHAVPGFSVDDPDLATVTAEEVDFLQVTVRLLNSSGTPFSAVDYSGITLAVTASNGDGDGTFATIDADKDGNGDYLILRGGKEDINATLATLKATFPGDRDNIYQIQVIADDRVRDNSGILVDRDPSSPGTTEPGGNGGGTLNQSATPGGLPTTVLGTEYNWYGDAVPTSGDITGNIAARSVVVRASNFNDPPVFTNPASYSVNEDAQVTLTGFALTDVDSFGENVTVTVRLYADAGHVTLADAATQGRLVLGATAGLTSAAGNNTNTITLVGSVAEVEAALNALQFAGAADYNGTGGGTSDLYLRTTVADYTHAGAQNTVSVDNTITIVPVNDQPTLSVPGDKTLSSGASISIGGGFVVGDGKDIGQGATDYVEVTVAATESGGAYGQIGVTPSGGATVVNNNTATITVKGSTADVQDTLNSMVYTPDNHNVDRTIEITTTVDDRVGAVDGTGNGVEGVGVDGNNTIARTFNINISSSNEPPSVTAPLAAAATEDATFAFTGASQISIADADDFGAAEQVTLDLGASAKGTITLTTHTGLSFSTGDGIADTKMVFTGTKAAINTALATLIFTPTANINTVGSGNEQNLTITVNDQGNTGVGGALQDSKTVTITITPVNDAPTRSDAIAVSLPAILEDSPSSGPGAPAGDTVANLFGPKFQDTTDQVGGGSSANPFAGIAITANAATAAQGTWQYSSDGGGTWVNLPAVSGVAAFQLLTTDMLRFVPAANFNGTPGALTARLIDGSSPFTPYTNADVSNDTTLSGGTTRYSNSLNAVTLTTSVTPINDAPTITGLDATSVNTYTENGLAVQIDGNAVLADPELDGTDWNKATLTVARQGGASSDDVFGATGSLSFTGGGGGDVVVSGITVGTYSQSGGTLVITFNSSATAARVDSVIQGLTYRNSSDDPPNSVTLDYTVDDQNPNISGGGTAGSGVDQGIGGKLLGNASITINITRLPDAPLIGAVDAVFTEGDSPVTLAPALALSDADDTHADGAVVQITTGLQSGYDTLAVAGTSNGDKFGGTNITVNYDAATGTLTLTGNDTVANYRAALRAVTFRNSSEDPTLTALTGSRTVTWSVTDANSDGFAAATTGTTTSIITVYPVDDAPTIGNLDGTSANRHLQGGGAVVIDADATLGDHELAARDNWAGAKLSIARATGADTDDLFGAAGSLFSGTFASGDVVVSSTTIGTYTQASGSLVITFNGAATTSLVNTTLRSLTYANAETAPGTLSYNTVTLRVTIDDQNTDTTGGGTAGSAAGAQNQGAGGLKTDAKDIVVNINRIPIANPDGAAIDEGATSSSTSTVGGNVINTAGAGLDTDQDGDSLEVQGVAAGNIGGILNSNVGGDVTGAYGKVVIAADGSYTYTLDNTLDAVQQLTVGMQLTDVFTYTINDGHGGTSTTTLTITINGTNDAPVAVNDANDITEDAVPNTVSGNVTPGTPGQDSDVDIGDTFTVTAFRTGTEAAGSGSAGNVGGAALTGSYGSLTLNADGSYTYTLDNTNPAVNALKLGDTLPDYFTYTITDNHGVSDTAQLTITIHGTTDGGIGIVPDDGNGGATGQATVHEAGLTSAVDTSETTTGTIAITASDGLASVTVEGTQVSLAQLNDLAAHPINIDTGEGILTLTGFTASSSVGGVPTAGSLSYTYTLKTAVHQPGASESTDDIALAVHEPGGGGATATLSIQIVDDIPTAHADANNVDEGTTTAPTTTFGNVFSGGAATDVADRIGADGTGTPVTAVSFGGVAKPVGEAFVTQYGSLTLNADGSYSYVVDNRNPTVDAMNVGDTLKETFSYVITDADGDTSTAQLVITIHGVNDAPVANDDSARSPDRNPVTINVLGNDSDVDDSVFHVTAISGIPIAPGGTVTLPSGSVTLNLDGTLTFAPGPTANGRVAFTYELTDAHGGTATATVMVDVNSTKPLPLPTPPIPSTPPPGPLFNDQSHDPSVFRDGAVFNGIPRLPIPFFPAVFVGHAVEAAHNELVGTDARTMGSDPRIMLAGEIESGSIGAGLGFDPALFVQHSVRASQNEGAVLGATVAARHGVLSLSSDGEIGTPVLFHPTPDSLLPPLPAETVALVDDPHDLPAGTDAAGMPAAAQATTTAPLAVQSFSDQIRGAHAKARPGSPRAPQGLRAPS